MKNSGEMSLGAVLALAVVLATVFWYGGSALLRTTPQRGPWRAAECRSVAYRGYLETECRPVDADVDY